MLLNCDMASLWKVTPATAVIKSSVLATGAWYRLTVSDDGVYKLDAKYLTNPGINLAGIDPRTIKVYGNGGTPVPENVFAARGDDLVEDAIYVEGESDGKFDSGDFVLLWPLGAGFSL